jgi:hypothetical protein
LKKFLQGLVLKITGTDGGIIPTQAILYKGGQPIDTIVTDMNGMAVFQVIPEPGSNLFLRIPSGEQFSDFDLPLASSTGISLHLDKAVLPNLLRIVLTASGKSKYHVVVHNFKEAFDVYDADFPGRSSTTIQTTLDDVPCGLATITVLDESGNPVAERMFFAHSDQKPAISISSDWQVYSTGQQIILSIKAATEKPLGGVISIACVNTNRINPSNFSDIVSYNYLTHEIAI